MDDKLLHDLRLPLQLIQSGARMAQLAMGDDALNAAEYLELINENVDQLKEMLEAAMAGSQRATVDVCDALRGLCLRCQGYAAERGVTLAFHPESEGILLRVDEARLSRAALNLIMNALRFTPAGGRVEVTCRALGDFMEITVRDQGPGIAPDRQPYIFLRGETDGGLGCGLPSALDCARALGGTLTVESAPGKGSAFTLRLPLGSALAS